VVGLGAGGFDVFGGVVGVVMMTGSVWVATVAVGGRRCAARKIACFRLMRRRAAFDGMHESLLSSSAMSPGSCLGGSSREVSTAK